MKSHAMPAVDPGEGPGHPPPPLIFTPNWDLKVQTKFFLETGLPSRISGSGWLPPPPLLTEGLDPPLHAHATIKETARLRQRNIISV